MRQGWRTYDTRAIRGTRQTIFGTEIIEFLNQNTVKLPLILRLINIIRAFEAKQQTYSKNIISKNYEYFPNLKKFTGDLDLNEKTD